MLAILNHMPWWAGTMIVGAVVGGCLIGAWLTRDDAAEVGKRWWQP